MRERTPDEPPSSPSRGLTLGVVYLTATAIIFGLGIWLGQDMARRHPDDAEVIVRRTAPPAPAGGAAPRPVDKEFFDEIREGMYDDLRAEDAPPTSTAGVAVAATKVAPTLAKDATRAPTAKPTLTRKLPPTATRKVPPTATRRLPPTATRTPLRRATPTAVRAAERKTGTWVVQVIVTRSESEALRTTMELRSRNFQASTDRTASSGVTWYKVRLGPFASRREADAAYARLRDTGKFNSAYLATQ